MEGELILTALIIAPLLMWLIKVSMPPKVENEDDGGDGWEEVNLSNRFKR